MKTYALRKQIKSKLDGLTSAGATYYRRAPDNAAFPYKTFEIETPVYTDAREDVELTVDVWDLGQNPTAAEAIADAVEALFGTQKNYPNNDVLPTFWRESRNVIDDPDKNIQRVSLRFLVQVYTT